MFKDLLKLVQTGEVLTGLSIQHPVQKEQRQPVVIHGQDGVLHLLFLTLKLVLKFISGLI